MKLDLHSHSLASDGSYTPAELLKFAETFGVTHLALTDHDTVLGTDEFLNTSSKIARISGIEISVDVPKGEFHMVGLFVDHKNKSLIDLTKKVKQFRDDRNEALLKKLSKTFGKPLTKQEILGGRDGQLGRPNIANYLVRNNLALSMSDAFKKYLSADAIKDIPKKKVEMSMAVDAVKAAGGVAVLAHPSTLNLDDDELDARIKLYKDNGLDAVEVYSSHTDNDKRGLYLEISKRYGLAVSGGSDFHGENSTIKTMGADFDSHNLGIILDDLISRSTGKNIKFG